MTRSISLALGAGGLGYAVYWLWAGFRAPGLGGTGAAKESLKWLATPSSGLVVVGTALVAILCLLALRPVADGAHSRSNRCTTSSRFSMAPD